MGKLPGLKVIQKNIPKASGVTQAAIVGIGSYKVGRFLDGLIGNRIQAIGVNLPFVGRLSVLDAMMLLAFKGSMRKNSMVAAAFAGDRILNLGQAFAGISGPTAQSAPKTGTAAGGGF